MLGRYLGTVPQTFTDLAAHATILYSVLYMYDPICEKVIFSRYFSHILHAGE